jgi:hypothetical protein
VGRLSWVAIVYPSTYCTVALDTPNAPTTADNHPEAAPRINCGFERQEEAARIEGERFKKRW